MTSPQTVLSCGEELGEKVKLRRKCSFEGLETRRLYVLMLGVLFLFWHITAEQKPVIMQPGLLWMDAKHSQTLHPAIIIIERPHKLNQTSSQTMVNCTFLQKVFFHLSWDRHTHVRTALWSLVLYLSCMCVRLVALINWAAEEEGDLYLCCLL